MNLPISELISGKDKEETTKIAGDYLDAKLDSLARELEQGRGPFGPILYDYVRHVFFVLMFKERSRGEFHNLARAQQWYAAVAGKIAEREPHLEPFVQMLLRLMDEKESGEMLHCVERGGCDYTNSEMVVQLSTCIEPFCRLAKPSPDLIKWLLRREVPEIELCPEYEEDREMEKFLDCVYYHRTT